MKKIVLLFIFLVGCTPKIDHLFCPFSNDATAWDKIKNDPYRFIAHAGGEIEGHRYTDSAEAMHKSLASGFRLIEFDLDITSEGVPVAVHDWDHWRQVTGFKGDKVSLVDYKKQKIHGKLNGITLAEVSEIFKKKSEVYLVTDKIKDYELLNKTFYSMDRLLVEVFSSDDFYAAVKAGIKFPMIALTTDDQVRFAVEKKIKIATIHSADVKKYQVELRKIVDDGGCVFAYSSNESQFIKNAIADRLITGVYTDAWDLSKGGCEPPHKCDTY